MVQVSVIMPSYNSASFIEEAIRSVISQTYEEWELLVIDDCSTDDSLEIVRKWEKKERRIRSFKTSSSSGSPAVPRNMGIKYAQGRFIAFLDSDDVWLPTKLEEQIPLFENPDVAVVFSNYEKMSEDGTCSNRKVIAPQTTCYKKLLKGNVIGNVTGIYDTKKVAKVFFREVHHEDYVLWLDILRKGYIAMNTNSVLALYRVRRQSVSSNKLKAILWQWNIYMNIERIGYLKTFYYFCSYAYRAFLKHVR